MTVPGWFARKFRPLPTDAASMRALAESERTLADAQAKRPEVDEVVDKLRKIRTANHFAEMTLKALGAHRDRPA